MNLIVTKMKHLKINYVSLSLSICELIKNYEFITKYIECIQIQGTLFGMAGVPTLPQEPLVARLCSVQTRTIIRTGKHITKSFVTCAVHLAGGLLL